MKEKMRKILSFIRHNKIAVKLVSFFLSLVLVFYVIPYSIYSEAAELFSEDGAAVSEGAPSDEASSKSAADTSQNAPLTAYEDKSLREESVKHFHLSDGSYIAAQYGIPVHYVDENGQWADIDNALADSGSEYANSNTRIKFAKKITGNESLFTLHDGNTKITMSLIGANKGTVGSVTNNSDSEEETELQKMMNLEKLSSKILYADILDGIDLEYVAYSKNVKENIIVKEKKNSYVYSFELKLNGLTPTLTEIGDIQLTDDESGEIKYTIPAPVVFDASGAYAPSQMGSYTLEYHNGKKYTLTVSVNPEWMNAEDRVFPVTVDPTIGVPHQHTIDLEIMSSMPNLNLESDFSLTVSATARSYWKIPSEYLPALSASSYISKAELKLFGGGNNCYVGAYNVISDWDETLTWAKTISASPQGTFGDTVYDYNSITYGDSWYGFDITQAVRQWYNGGNNYGIGLKLIDESDTTKSTTFYSYEYYDDYDDRYVEPSLYIYYSDLSGLEGYLSYSSHSAGIAGSGNVNLANGNLVFAIPTLTTTDGIFGYTTTLYYNSSLAGKDYVYGNAKTAYATSYMPNGFKLNICETIINESYTTVDNTTAYQYIHADADGTEHYYLSSGASGIYKDEDGLGKTMTVSANKIEITDDSHIIKRFSKMSSTPNSSVLSAWYLKEIEDVVGNKLVFTFDTYRPTEIKLCPNGSDSEILLMTLLYTTDGKLCAIYDHGTQNAIALKYSANYSGSEVYSGGKYLRKVEYCYLDDYPLGDVMGVQHIDDYANGNQQAPNIDSSADYFYDSTGRLTWAADEYTRHGIGYAWSNNQVSTIFEEVDQEPGKSIEIEYLTGATDIYSPGNDGITRTADDIVTRYVFDSYGRAISKYSTSYDRKEIYGATMGVYDTQENSKNSLVEKTVMGSVNSNLLKNGDFQDYSKIGTVTALLGWTSSSNVTKNLIKNIGADYPTSIKISPTPGNDAYVSQTVSLVAGDYTLTVHHQSYDCENIQGYVRIINSSAETVIASEPIKLSNGDTENSFTSLSFTLEEATTVSVNITFSVVASLSTSSRLNLGMVKLEKGKTQTDYNLVENGDFETGTLINWFPSPLQGVTIENDPENSDYYVKVNTSIDSSQNARQLVYSATSKTLSNSELSMLMPENNDIRFIVSGFAKAENAIPSRPFRLKVEITYYLGANENDVTSTYYYDFNPYCTDWQFVSGEFSLSRHQSGESLPVYKCVKSVNIYCEFSQHVSGYALFDDISIVYKGPGKTNVYEYNSDGKLTKSIEGYYTEYYEYNSDGNLSRVANSRGELTDYEYTSLSEDTSVPKHLISKIHTNDYIRNSTGTGNVYPYWEDDPNDHITVTEKTTMEYGYNNYGQVTSITTTNAADTSIFTKEEYTYVENLTSKLFGLILTEQSRADSKTKYFYEEHSGRLLASINTYSGSGYVYTYDGMGRLLEVNPANYTAPTDTYTANTPAEYVEYEYGEDKRISRIVTSTADYIFSYDEFGNTSEIATEDGTLATYEYDDYNGKLKKVTYGNGFYTEYVYNEKEQLREVKYNGTTRYKYEYTDDGQVYKLTDVSLGTYVIYYYDNENRLIGFRELDSSGNENVSSKVTYDLNSFISDIKYEFKYNLTSGTADELVKHSYTYLEDGRLNYESIYSSDFHFAAQYFYDTLDRITSVVYNGSVSGTNGSFSNTVDYTYKSDATYGETGLVETYTSTTGNTLTRYIYTYDSNGNITRVSYSNGRQIRYYYDDMNQLIREDNTLTNETYVYTYDRSGNMLKKEEYALTAYNKTPTALRRCNEFGYSDDNWIDLLVSYNGQEITRDQIGNPLNYYNGFTFTWEGRRMITATKNGVVYAFTYNEDGLRTSKIKNYGTSNPITTNYYYSGTLLIKEESPTLTIVYLYDANGSPIGFKFRSRTDTQDVWDEYFYEKNLFGDIVAVYDSMGNKLYSYTYDAWGRFARTQVLSMPTTAIVNPYLYRGYYYDSDLGFYYLQSRYYDPNTCRFINADSYVSTGQGILGYNMFAYCGNNPVMYRDDSGNARSHVMVSCYDGGSYNDNCNISTYPSSSGKVIILAFKKSISKEEKPYYLKIYSKYIIVFDNRQCKEGCDGECDPNMQIWNSYLIDESAKQREILEILYAYDQANPSRHAWGRTVDSMLKEWDAHNDYYNAQFSIFVDTVFKWTTREQARCVDFNKNAEDFSYYEHFTKPLINKIIH